MPGLCICRRKEFDIGCVHAIGSRDFVRLKDWGIYRKLVYWRGCRLGCRGLQRVISTNSLA
jgi:hypothetical protein